MTRSILLVLLGAVVGGMLVAFVLYSVPPQEIGASPGLSQPEVLGGVEADLPSGGALPEAGVKPQAREEVVSPSSEWRHVANAPLFGATLLKVARDKMRSGWAQIRTDQMGDDELVKGTERFREETPELAFAIGAELARNRTENERALEDARTGGVFDLLGRLEGGAPGPVTEVVFDGKTFDQFFVSENTGPSLNGVSALSNLKNNEPVADGSTLTFPAGVFTLKNFGSYWREHFPRDLTIRGAGMNATLLVLGGNLSAYDLVRNMTFEDFSVHANDNYLFDIRQPSMSLTMRRVRVTGWDMGAGSSCAFGTDGLALRAVDCDFLGGYGRSPSYGNLFDVRHNGLLARFDGCLISRTNVYRGLRPGATVVFSRSRLEDVLDRNQKVPDNVILDSTPISYWSSESGLSLKRDLNDLFPAWKERLNQ